jgi:hypothetical protein
MIFNRWLLASGAAASIVVLVFMARREIRTPTSFYVAPHSDVVGEAKLERALACRVSCKFQNVPLEKAIAQLAAQAGVSIVLDGSTLTDASINSTTPVSLEITGISLRSALRLAHEPFDLCCTPHGDEPWVTTPERFSSDLS